MRQLLINWMILFPLLGAVAQGLLAAFNNQRSNSSSSFRWAAILCSLGSSLCGISVVVFYRLNEIHSQSVEWFGAYSINYRVDVDGFNVLLVLLLALIFPILVIYEWKRKNESSGLFALLLLLQTSLVGAVVSQDLFLLFFFWSFSALPFYFLVGIWGEGDKEKSAFQLIVTNCLGNAFFLFSILMIYYAVEPRTFLFESLSEAGIETAFFEISGKDYPVSMIAFIGISLGIALRAPIWPFHGWYVSAVKHAIPSVFVALSAGAIPVALYIFFRITYLLLPETIGELGTWISRVGTVNLVLASICALAQRDLKKLFAYVCLGEVGYLLIGMGSLTSSGLVGSLYHHFVFGLSAAGFGLLTGLIIQRSKTSQFLDENQEVVFGGIAKSAPVLAVVAGVVVASLMSFPGLAGFVSHALTIIGAFESHPIQATTAQIAVLATTFFLLRMYNNIFLGEPKGHELEDMDGQEKLFFVPIILLLLVFGIYPKPLLDLIRGSVLSLLDRI